MLSVRRFDLQQALGVARRVAARAAIEICILVVAVAASAIPGGAWLTFDQHLYVDGQKVVPIWLLGVWPIYTSVFAFFFGWAPLKSPCHAALRAAVVVIWLVALILNAAPLSASLLIAESCGGTISNPGQLHSCDLAFALVPTAFGAGLVIKSWGNHGYVVRYSLRTLLLSCMCLGVWLAFNLALLRGFAALDRAIAALSANY